MDHSLLRREMGQAIFGERRARNAILSPAAKRRIAKLPDRFEEWNAVMLLKSLHLRNFLSFGRDSLPVELGPLNVIIGANGSGKSNFIEAIDLMRAAPCASESSNTRALVRDGGGVDEWIWNGAEDDSGTSIEAVLDRPGKETDMRYVMRFAVAGQDRFEIREERVEDAIPSGGRNDPHFFYRRIDGKSMLEENGEHRDFRDGEIDAGESILAHCKDPEHYPELAWLGETFAKMRIYREWNFGRNTVLRDPQMADQSDAQLAPNADNIGLVLLRLCREPEVKERILKALRKLYDGIDDFYLQLEQGKVQLFIQEGSHAVPVKRLSDGTLRYLSLLAILCHPNPAPLICIEEPELGMHPDVVITIAKLLVEASENTQLIVTTHSDFLVDVLTKQPESVFVAENDADGTHLERLEAEKIKPWLKDYGNSLGEFWMSGHIGGLRW